MVGREKSESIESQLEIGRPMEDSRFPDSISELDGYICPRFGSYKGHGSLLSREWAFIRKPQIIDSIMDDALRTKAQTEKHKRNYGIALF